MRRRRGELAEIGKSERLFDLPDLHHGIVEPVLAELLVLDVLEPFTHLVKLPTRQRILPCREHDRVLAGRMVLIHQHEGLEGTGQRFASPVPIAPLPATARM